MHNITVLDEMLKKIELTPTMYMIIEKSYKSLSGVLQKDDYEIEIYPQGSVRLGTTIKPYKENKDTSFDVDLISQYSLTKKAIQANELKCICGDRLMEDARYSDKLEEKKRCWRINYAEKNGFDFHADVLPAIKESSEVIADIKTLPGFENLKKYSLSITNKKENDDYDWSKSNPKGYALWFDSVNDYQLENILKSQRTVIFEANRNIFDKEEDIPKQLVKTSLQRVIQLLKRHRDVYFSRSKQELDKPISIIITTLVTRIVNMEEFSKLDTFDLLKKVLDSLVNAKKLIINEEFRNYAAKDFIYKVDKKWNIPNPINTEENFADAWNATGSKKANVFFEWLEALDTDIFENIDNPNFIKILCNKLALNCDDLLTKEDRPNKINNLTSSQPWGINGQEQIIE